MSIFKACDVRGIYPDEINEEKVYRIGRAIGTIIESAPILVGGDVRLSTETLRIALVDGLRHSGCQVTDIGVVPTPVLYYARKKLDISAAVMITASHNPADQNGLKIVLGPLPITEQDLIHIKQVADTKDHISRLGSVKQEDVIDDYEKHIVELTAKPLAGIAKMPKVVVDCGSGCYSDIAPRVFQRMGINRVRLFCEADGTFPERSPNSADPKALVDLSQRVREEKADLGVAFDGDGDRVAFVDETGAILTAEQYIAIMAMYGVCVGPSDSVVLDIKCGTAAVESITKTGAKIITERSGHTFIKTSMIQTGAVMGGEVSGHLFFNELDGGDDGLYAGLLMTSIIGKHGKLSSLVAKLPHYPITPDLRIKVEKSAEILGKIATAFPAGQVSRQDGVRVAFSDGWGLARQSVTEPAITLRFEGRTPEALENVIQRFLAPVPEIKEMVNRKLAKGR